MWKLFELNFANFISVFVSEELSSVETEMLLLLDIIYSKFQKNLVVWKPSSFGLGIISTS